MLNSWTLLRTNSTTQTRFCDHIREKHPTIILYYPQYKRWTRPHGVRRPILSTRPVYPGYVFACPSPDPHDFYTLTHSPVRAWFVRFGSTIPTIPDSIIQELRRLESLNKLVIEERHQNPYHPGRKVTVHIPVADIQAVIIRLIAQTKVKVDTPLGVMTVPIHKVTLS